MTGRVLLGVGLVAAVALLLLGCGGSSPKGPPDLIFVSSRDGDYAIFASDLDGRHQRRLTHDRGDFSTPSGLFFQVEPAWSPDGRRIAFASRRTGTSRIFVMLADGTGTRQLTSGRENDAHPTWSPDGQQVAFVRGDQGDLEIVSAYGSGLHRLLRTEAAESDPAWSPDGRWIVYSRRTPGTSAKELWLVRPDGSGRHPLTGLDALSTSPAWSPDGGRIVFQSDHGGTSSGIFIIGVDGKGFRRLGKSVNDDDIEPAWSPDGKTIAFSRNGHIETVDMSGALRQLTGDENNDSRPAFRPHSAG